MGGRIAYGFLGRGIRVVEGYPPSRANFLQGMGNIMKVSEEV